MRTPTEIEILTAKNTALKKELEEALLPRVEEVQLITITSERDQFRERCERYEKALQKYADKNNWCYVDDSGCIKGRGESEDHCLLGAGVAQDALLSPNPEQESEPKGIWWCNSHQRKATYKYGNGSYGCDPRLGGVMIACSVVFAEMEDPCEYERKQDK